MCEIICLQVEELIQLNNLNVPVFFSEEEIKKAAAKKLKINENEIIDIAYIRKSIDARKKSNVVYSLCLGVSVKGNEKRIAEKAGCTLYCSPKLCYPEKMTFSGKSPIVCGAGPAGLFAALFLSMAGFRPILLEQGDDADTRISKINEFFSSGKLDVRTNVQFGEGGAGTFSDGKLTTNISDFRCATVLDAFVLCGAPKEILYSAKPHLGTDKLCGIVKNIRKKIIESGGSVRFLSKITDICVENGQVVSVTVNDTECIECDRLIIAAGHSAQDMFHILKEKNVQMEQKPFSIGVRVEHKQADINAAQYGNFAKYLGAADYKLSCHLPSGRGVYSFCMCPGGKVVAAASSEGKLVVNGMSLFARDGENANSAILCSVFPEDFGSSDVLAGLEFQQKYEKAAFEAGGGNYRAPAQLMGDMLADIPSTHCGTVNPTYPLGVTWCSLKKCLPEFAYESIKQALVIFNKKINGFLNNDAVLTGVETRSSSPVRVLRNGKFQSSVSGIYPCGEGAGYAGGIMSAAVDGIRVAQQIIGEITEN